MYLSVYVDQIKQVLDDVFVLFEQCFVEYEQLGNQFISVWVMFDLWIEVVEEVYVKVVLFELFQQVYVVLGNVQMCLCVVMQYEIECVIESLGLFMCMEMDVVYCCIVELEWLVWWMMQVVSVKVVLVRLIVCVIFVEVFKVFKVFKVIRIFKLVLVVFVWWMCS